MSAFVLPIKPSRFLLILLLSIHLLALISIALCTIPEWIKIIAGFGLILHAFWQYYIYGKQGSDTQLGINASGVWCKINHTQCWVKILPSTIITRGFVSLHLQSTETHRRFYLFLPAWHYARCEYRALSRSLLMNS